MAAHIEAHREATALCLTLGGVSTKWRPRVWENLGWHYGAISPCGRLKVYPHIHAGYHAFLGSEDSSGGRWVESGRTAQAAIRKVVARGMSERDVIDALLRDLPDIGGRELVPREVAASASAMVVDGRVVDGRQRIRAAMRGGRR